MEIGDKINWHYEPKGGYGFIINVAGVVTKIGPKKVQIRVAKKIDGEWIQELKWVNAEKLYPRELDNPEVDTIF